MLPHLFLDGHAWYSVYSSRKGRMMRDAPICDQCGHITVRNGLLLQCLNCGNSMGCS